MLKKIKLFQLIANIYIQKLKITKKTHYRISQIKMKKDKIKTDSEYE